MYFCYFDESGDAGYFNSPSVCFTLAGVLVRDEEWLDTLDQLIQFRRYLRDQFKIPPRAELKANWLLHGKGDFKHLGLSPDARLNAYRAAMRFQRKVGTIRTFAVVIAKDRVYKKTVDAREWAWGRAIERLDRFAEADGELMHVLPDEGHGYFIRHLLRRMRRHHYIPPHYGGARIQRKTLRIVEDSSDRQSHESYFIQLADLNAYAAFRKVFPKRHFDGAWWDELGNARIREVNRLAGGPEGIVLWPKK